MTDFFGPDLLSIGTKGVVYVGDRVVVYRRTDDAPNHPGELDMPGGAPEKGETPFQTFQREVFEEVGLQITPKDIVFTRRYPSTLSPGKFGWHAVAKLPASAEQSIVFGDEGQDLRLMPLETFMASADASTFLKTRTADYLKTLENH